MSRPIHPLLFAAFPVLFLVAHNRDVTSISEALVPLGLTLGAVVGLQLIAGRLFGSPRKVAVVVSALALLFFSYGHAWTILARRSLFGIHVTDVMLASMWGTLAVGLVVTVAHTRRKLVDATRVLNAIAIVLVATTLSTVAIDAVGGGRTALAAPGNEFGLVRPEQPRDIYYLIFDRYADDQTLRTHLGFDNSPFTRFLEGKGFDVTPESRANYQNTHMSLASSLNMQHLDTLMQDVRRPSTELEPIFDKIKRSAVATALKSVGYSYVHVGSWAAFTASSPIADINLKPVETSELTRALYGSTALSPLLRRGLTASDDETQRDATRGALRALDEAIAVRGPKFVFAHFILPHPPYVFDRNGNYGPERERDGNVRGYLEQVRYTNGEIERIVNRLLAVPADEQPIIVIQADEGPYPRLSTRIPASWTDESDSDLRVKFGILNAYFLPGPRSEFTQYPSITPVNTFRMLFTRYFGANLPVLPDTSYAIADKRDAYTLVPLGDRVRGRPAPYR